MLQSLHRAHYELFRKPLPQLLKKTTVPELSPVVPGGGSTFAVPDDTDIDESSFFGQDVGTSPTQGLYPDLSAHDDTLGF